eukprot:scaffold82824_cov20-Tisochrysis_lutea.AAC.1
MAPFQSQVTVAAAAAAAALSPALHHPPEIGGVLKAPAHARTHFKASNLGVQKLALRFLSQRLAWQTIDVIDSDNLLEHLELESAMSSTLQRTMVVFASCKQKVNYRRWTPNKTTLTRQR